MSEKKNSQRDGIIKKIQHNFRVSERASENRVIMNELRELSSYKHTNFNLWS